MAKKTEKVETVADAAPSAEATVSTSPTIHPRVAELMRRGYGLPLAEATHAAELAELAKQPAAEGSQ